MDESGNGSGSSDEVVGFCQSMSVGRGSVGNGKTSFAPDAGVVCFSVLGEEGASSVDPFCETGA
jgi:hypothetical protein